jgi:membrane protein YdbS with pleckstrin-like domain
MNAPWLPPIPEQSKLTEFHRLNWYESIDLRKHYKIRFTLIIQKIFPWLVGYVSALGLLALFGRLELIIKPSTPLDFVLCALLATATLMLLILAVFWEIYRQSIEVRLEGLRLTFSHGVMKKSTGSLIIRSQNIVNVYQTPPDRLFGVYQLQIYGSNQPETEYALIPALSSEDAFDLFRFLASNLSKQLKVNSNH